MRKILAIGAMALVSGVPVLTANSVSAAPVFQAPIKTLELPLHTTECQEDEPCWDCHTMGNKICGPDILQAWTFGPGAFAGTGSAGPLRKG